MTGSHESSLELIRTGVADVAAVDAHSWTALSKRGVTVVDRTESAPSPPFVVGPNVDTEALHAALAATVRSHGALIGLAGIRPAERADYQVLHEEARSTTRPEVLSILDPRLTTL